MVEPSAHVALAWRELSGGLEALAVFPALRREPCPWLLDSALRGERLGRYSFAGASPWALLRANDGVLELDVRRSVAGGPAPGCTRVGEDLMALSRRWLPRLPADASAPPVPFVGGALALLGYELAAGLEPVELRGIDDLALPDATLLLVDRLIAWDHVARRAFACALGFGSSESQARCSAAESLEATGAWLEPVAPAAPRRMRGAKLSGVAAPQPFDANGYAKAVSQIKGEIEAGNVYQANLTQRMERRFLGDSWELYRTLRRINPAPFACFVELPEVAVVGSSPERFLKVEIDGRVESRPIKGTRPRGRHAAEDAALKAELAASEKDRAENLMIVDLVRNDLGRVCVTGSVSVPELMEIEEYASVFQLVSSVTGRLRSDRDVFDCIAAAFPPGSMTGAPKIAAMRLLDHLEPVRRALYSGAIGYLDARGGADLCVVIRTLFVQGERALLHAGGGVVADSDPDAEWLESLVKARALLAALKEVGAVPSEEDSR
ncbi:MAG: aminodeoxychorismate synthase component I [Deltaproteobacteria bacterium]|nr:aminodeoxychorismate synthase component I [Deltaproteobacteria bacterium]